MKYFVPFLLILSILTPSVIPLNAESISPGKKFDGADRNITWRPWQQNPTDEFRFRTERSIPWARCLRTLYTYFVRHPKAHQFLEVIEGLLPRETIEKAGTKVTNSTNHRLFSELKRCDST